MSAETGLYVGLAILAGFVIFSGFLIIYAKKTETNSEQHKKDK